MRGKSDKLRAAIDICGAPAPLFAMSRAIIDRWSTKAAQAAEFMVLPDGCRDVIIAQKDGSAPRAYLSPLMMSPMTARAMMGERKTGYRLAPGTQVDCTTLQNLLKTHEPDQECSAQIEAICTLAPRVSEAISCLSEESAPIAKVARRLGVSERSLQKLFSGQSLPSPVYWLQLARVRRAGVALLRGRPLTEAAFEHGYSDHAHMSRSFKRFFGMAPKDFLHSSLAQQLHAPALATGEQISTKMPSASLT